MLELGSCNGKSLFAEFNNGNFRFEGPNTHFHGYRINSGTPGDGVYVQWSATDTSVMIETDRLGMLPYFVYHRNGQLIVSHDIHHILQQVPNYDFPLDYNALSVQLRLGYFLSDDTAFLDIKRLPANGTLLFSENGLKINLRREPPVNVRDVCLEEALRLYGEKFDELMSQLLSNNSHSLIVPASGGRDSRHILLALKRLNIRPSLCVTQRHLPPTADDDYVCAAKLCEALGFDHKVIEKSHDILDDEKKKNFLLNYEAVSHGWIMPTISELAGKNGNIILDGLGGDILSESRLNQNFFDLYKAKRFTDLAKLMMAGGNYLETFLTPEFRAHCSHENAINILASKLEEYQNHNNPIIEFYFYNRTRRSIAPSCWNLFGYNNHVITPFIAASIHHLLVSFPPQLHEALNLHTQAIASRYPEYADIPYADSKDITLPSRPEHVKNIITSLRTLAFQTLKASPIRAFPMLMRIISVTRSKQDLVRFLAFQNRFTLLHQNISARDRAEKQICKDNAELSIKN